MADLNARIKPKKSSTTGEVPQAADLEVAEIAVNTADGKLFVKHTDDSIKEISGGGGGAVDSVNGQTGAVSLDIYDMTNVSLKVTPFQTLGDYIADGSDDLGTLGYGRYQFVSTSQMAFAKDGNYPTAAGGGYNTDINAKWDTWLAGPKTSLWISVDGTSFTEYTTTAATTQDTLPTIVLVTFASRPSLDPDNDEIYVELTDPALQSTELPPVDGQVLTWVNANSQWEPADSASGGAVELNDLSDVSTSVAGPTFANDLSPNGFTDTADSWSASPSGPNDWILVSSTVDGVDISSWLNSWVGGDIIEYYNANTGDLITSYAFVARDLTFGAPPALLRMTFRGTNGSTEYDTLQAYSGPLTVVNTARPYREPSDGQVLTYVAANGQWENVDSVTTIDGLTDVDTSTTSPTDGQVLTWDNANSQWEPADAAGGAAAIDELTDVDTSTTPPTDGQVLSWVAANNKWEPANVGSGGGGALPSVTGWAIDSTSASVTSRAYNVPTHNTGELLVACISHRSALTLPSGWTLHGTYLSSLTYNTRISVCTKIASASEPASYTWTQSSTARMSGYIASVTGNATIESVSQNYGNGRTATIDVTGGALNMTAATWIYAGSAEDYNQAGPGVVEITDSPQSGARMSGGYTYEAGTVTSTHDASDTVDSPNHGMINIRLAPATSINSFDDVDTVSTLPTDGQVLTWVDANSQWEPADAAGGATTIDGLTDVDTSTTPPADDQVLTWVDANSQWEPSNIGINSLSDVTTSEQATVYTELGRWNYNTETGFPGANGEWRIFSSGDPDVLQFYKNNVDGTDQSAEFLSLSTGTQFEWSFDQTTWATVTTVADTVFSSGGGGNTVVSISISNTDGQPIEDGSPAAGVKDIFVRIPVTDSIAASDGQVLTWVAANSRWEPGDLQGAAVRAALGIGEYVDDAAAGTGGIASGAMYYNTTSSDYRLKT